jgi:outer membrane protein OmpA-like peptidoglycan-associated protein
LRYEIQGHTDSQGSDEYNLVLSAARAGTVRGYLVVKGINDSSLIAIGYGESSPVADNSTSLGRATNRRVDFKIIESTQEYSDLKMKETVTRDIVRAAKIKGSQY